MSLFTTVDNQQMLWNLINKNKTFALCFTTHQQMQSWFRNIIEKFHINNNEPVNMIQLKQMNTTVIQYIIQDIKNIQNTNASENDKNVPVYENETQQSKPKTDTTDTVTEPENNILNSFEERQKDYYSLLEPQKPTHIDFTETKDEGVSIDDYNAKQEQYEKNINVTNPLMEENKQIKETLVNVQNEIADLRNIIQQMKNDFIKNNVNDIVEDIIDDIV